MIQTQVQYYFKTCGGSKNLQRFEQEFSRWFWQNAQLSPDNSGDIQKGLSVIMA